MFGTPPTAPRPTSGLIVRAVQPKRALLQLVKVQIEINETLYKRKWGETLFPLEPGRYQISVSCRWLFYPHLGRNSIVIDLSPGETAIVQWRPPLTVFQRGAIEQLA
jgi:hypothetical protein